MTTTDLPESTKPVEQAEQLLDVGEMEAGWSARRGRRTAPLYSVMWGGQLEPLALARPDSVVERLAEAEVAEPRRRRAGRGWRARAGGGAPRRPPEELLGLGPPTSPAPSLMSAAAEVVVQHRCLEPLSPFALLAGWCATPAIIARSV